MSYVVGIESINPPKVLRTMLGCCHHSQERYTLEINFFSPFLTFPTMQLLLFFKEVCLPGSHLITVTTVTYKCKHLEYLQPNIVFLGTWGWWDWRQTGQQVPHQSKKGSSWPLSSSQVFPCRESQI